MQHDNQNAYNKCYLRLFNNGIMILSEISKNHVKPSLPLSSQQKGGIVVYVLSNETKKCSPIINSNLFHFQIENIIQLHNSIKGQVGSNIACYHNKNGDSDDDSRDNNDRKQISIMFAIDKEESGNYLMDGWKWTSTIDNCVEVVGAVNHLCTTMNSQWE